MIAELKKENFSLKLRIYFLEERMQQKSNGEKEDLFKTVSIRDCPINRTCRLIAHATSDFDDRLQFDKIDYFDYFEKINCI